MFHGISSATAVLVMIDTRAFVIELLRHCTHI